MIVIPRKMGQSIMIGDDITLTVVDIQGDKTRLRIDCPRNALVHRKEVYDVIMGPTGGVETEWGWEPRDRTNGDF